MTKIKNIDVGKLINVYVKTLKKVPVYASTEVFKPAKQRQVWFTYEAGQIIGKCFSWVDAKNPNAGVGIPDGKIYMMFYIDNDPNKRPFFAEITPATFDWKHIDAQLTVWDKSELGWYDKIWYDLEKNVSEMYEAAKETAVQYLTYAAYAAGGFVVLYVLWHAIIKPELAARPYKNLARSIIKDVSKEIKNAK